MYPYALAKGLGKKSVRVCLSQICLTEERKLVKVFRSLDVLGLNALFVHEIAVVLHVFVNVPYLCSEALVLKLFHIFP